MSCPLYTAYKRLRETMTNTHQPQPWEEAAGRMIRRGEGGGAGLGGPSWSPVVGPLST